MTHAAVSERVTELLAEAAALPWNGSGWLNQLPLLEEAARCADAADDLAGAFRARYLLGSAAINADVTDRGVTALSWCLAQLDEHPERFPASTLRRLLDALLIAAERLPRFPEVPLSTIASVLDDLHRRLVHAGLPLQDYWVVNQLVWMKVGDHRRAEEGMRRSRALPRGGRLIDCDVCEANQLAEWAAERGDLDAAAGIAAPVFDGVATPAHRHCTALQLWLLAHGPLWLLHLGRDEQARTVGSAGLERVEGDPGRLDLVGAHLLRLAATGELDRAARLVEQHVPLARHLHPRDRLDFDTGVWALARAAGQGDGPLVLRLPPWHPDHDPAGRYDPSDLERRLAAPLRELCAQYDDRNGNHAVSRRWERCRRLVDRASIGESAENC